jgi:hypothetical protein|tara:strand:+ start:251 stop:496 length:246 start_codon:yes stop_codon:yes gene_type:complete
MTQYTEKVQEVLRKQAVEKWSKGTQYIAAQNGYVETALNDGSVKREYHRAHGDHSIGDVVYLAEGKPMEELMDIAPRDLLV